MRKIASQMLLFFMLVQVGSTVWVNPFWIAAVMLSDFKTSTILVLTDDRHEETRIYSDWPIDKVVAALTDATAEGED